MTGAPTLTTLVSFNGAGPESGLTADSNGDLFGATAFGGANDDGAAFEIVKTPTGYASTPTTLVSFNTNDDLPQGGLIADSNGDLFGTTELGGANGFGAVFEIVKTAGGYASTPTTLVSFNGDDANGAGPSGSLIADANGDLFGTTVGGNGTAFEIAKTADGYASTPTTLVSFNTNDDLPQGGLIADSNGDLFGTTELGGANDDGAVFEIVKTSTGYASTPTTLVSFNDDDDGEGPAGSLIADSNGDLFGTTNVGGPNGFGTAFEIVKTPTSYASTPTTLVGFNGTNGAAPSGSLIADANGDLFGTTDSGGVDDHGTVFEIVKTAGGYASTPTTLVSFNQADGSGPLGSLIADSNGDLFGTTDFGGANGDGTVFEITGGNHLLWQNTSGQVSIWDMSGNTLTGGGPVSANPGPSWKAIGMGDFDGGGVDDILWQSTTSGQASIWQMNGNSLIGGGTVSPNPGPNWRAVGVGDFDGDGLSDILWQNTTTGQASIWEMNGNTLTGGGPVSPNPGPAWKAVGAGDFTGDGHSDDILWQNTSTGQVSIWEMDGNTLMGGGPVSPDPGPSWQAIGTDDFNGDGRSDILFQNTSTGQVSIWEMNGNSLVGGGPVSPNPGPSWHAIGTDGGSDILFQNTSGQVSIWEMDGNKLIGGGPVSPNPGSSWRAVGLS